MPRKKADCAAEEPKKKKRMGRPPKVEAKRGTGPKRALPQREIDEIKSVAAAAHIEVVDGCPICARGEDERQKIENALLMVTAGLRSDEGFSTFGQIASRYQIPTVNLLAHRDKCMKQQAVLVLDKNGGNDVENAAAWIGKLAKYLEIVDRIIDREELEAEPDSRLLLQCADEGRKICETNAKMFIDLWKLQIDQKVQDDFIRMVLEVVDQVVPQAKEKIIDKLKGRLAMARAMGVRGAI